MYGHVMRRDQKYVGKRVMQMELLGKEKKREAEEKICGCFQG